MPLSKCVPECTGIPAAKKAHADVSGYWFALQPVVLHLQSSRSWEWAPAAGAISSYNPVQLSHAFER